MLKRAKLTQHFPFGELVCPDFNESCVAWQGMTKAQSQDEKGKTEFKY